MAHCVILKYTTKVFYYILSHLVCLRHVGVVVARITFLTRLLLKLVEELGSLLLKSLTERVVVLEADTVLLHEVVVGKLG